MSRLRNVLSALSFSYGLGGGMVPFRKSRLPSLGFKTEADKEALRRAEEKRARRAAKRK